MPDRNGQIEELLGYLRSFKQKVLNGHYLLPTRFQFPFSQWMVIHLLDKHNNCLGIKELSRMLGISSSAATQLVDTLVKKGYLIREINPEDRRALRIQITKETRERLEIGKIETFGKLYTLFNVLTDEELLQYCQLTRKIVENIVENPEADDTVTQ